MDIMLDGSDDIGRVGRRFASFREHHKQKEATFCATYDALNSKQTQQTQQLRQQYISNSTAGTGPKSKQSKAGGRGGNKRSNAASAAALDNGTDGGGTCQPTKGSKSAKMTAKNAANNATNNPNNSSSVTHNPNNSNNTMQLPNNIASSSPSSCMNVVPHQQVDFKNDIKPVANLTPNHHNNVNGSSSNASPMQSNSRPLSNNASSSIPGVPNGNGCLNGVMNHTNGLAEVKREVIDTSYFGNLNAADLTDFLHYPGSGVSGGNGTHSAVAPAANFCLDSMLGNNDLTKDISFDGLMDDCPLLSDEFMEEKNMQKLLDELASGGGGGNGPHSNQMHPQLMNGPNQGLRCGGSSSSINGGNSTLNASNNHLNNTSSQLNLNNSPNANHMMSAANRVMPTHSFNNNSRPSANNMNGISAPFHGNAHPNNQIQSSSQPSPLLPLPPPVRHASAASTLQLIATRTTSTAISPLPLDLQHLLPHHQQKLREQISWWIRYASGGRCNNIQQ